MIICVRIHKDTGGDTRLMHVDSLFMSVFDHVVPQSIDLVSPSMPLLPEEKYAHPQQILDEQLSESSPWWVLYTLPRREKLLCRHLAIRGNCFYCPVVEREYRSPAGRLRRSFLPLFPNYVFLRGDEESRDRAVATQCVYQSFPVMNNVGFLKELRQLHRILELNMELTVEAKVRRGPRARVMNGPAAGVEGHLLEKGDTRRLFFVLDLIQYSVSIDIHDSHSVEIGSDFSLP